MRFIYLKDGCTSLWVAAMKGHLRVASLLLDRGADMEAINRVSSFFLDMCMLRMLRDQLFVLPG